MNYIHQLNAFWEEQARLMNEGKGLSPTQSALYLALLHCNNQCGWREVFQKDKETLMAMSGINQDKTFYKNRDALVESGFVTLLKGSINKGSARYSIKVLYVESTNSPTNSPTYSDTNSSTNSATNINKHVNNINNKQPCVGEENFEEPEVVKAEQKISFDDFWKAYKKPTGSRLQTQTIWDSLTLDVQKIILAGLPDFLDLPDNSKDGRRYQPNALTFLHNKRWQEASYTKSKEQKAQDDLQRLCLVGYPYGQLEMTYADFLEKIERLPDHNKNYFTFKRFIAA